MGKHPRQPPPKRRSPVPPPARIIGDTRYQREDSRQRLRDAVREFEQGPYPSSPIRLVVLDLDGTLWAVETGSCGLLTPPIRKLGDVTVADASNNTVTLARDARRVLTWLRSRRILVSVANRSNPENAFRLLELFGLREFIACPAVGREQKSFLVKAIQQEVRTKYDLHLAPTEVLLVDDAESSIADVKRLGIRTALIGREIGEIADLPAFLSRIQ